MYFANKWIMTLLGAVLLALGNGGVLAELVEQKCDPSKPETTPASRFIVNKQEGTAFDTQTKLTWKLCSLGQIFKNDQCEGEAAMPSWKDALNTFKKDTLGWRMPSIDELETIIEKRCTNPAINQEIFPSVPSLSIWSATSIPGFNMPWTVSLKSGDVIGGDVISFALKSAKNKDQGAVLLVRGDEWLNPSGGINQRYLERESKNKLDKETRRKLEEEARARENKLESEAREKYKQKEKLQLEQRAVAFRKSLNTGDESNCGLVIEVKRPIAKIQTESGEHWLKVEQLYPQGTQACEQGAGDARATNPDSNRLVGTRVCKVFTGIRNRISGEGFCGPLANNIERSYVTCSGRIAVTGVVENVAGKKIQIRVSNVHVAENPKYYAPFQSDEGFIDRNSVIWDQATNWSGC